MTFLKLLVLTTVVVCATAVAAQVELDRNVVAAGGGTTGSAGHTISLTIGQAAVGMVTGNTYDLDIGFWTPGLGDPVPVLDEDLPGILSLDQNYPNPFNPMTMIRFSLPENAPVSLAVYNVRGERVRLLVDEVRPAGRHEVIWNGADDHGRSVSSGTYVARIVSSQGVQNRKMVLAR
ncbi:MAG: FlgD immunoglobulin-like domain containing protein [Candidatus Krumholzibacteriia bacterium]